MSTTRRFCPRLILDMLTSLSAAILNVGDVRWKSCRCTEHSQNNVGFGPLRMSELQKSIGGHSPFHNACNSKRGNDACHGSSSVVAWNRCGSTDRIMVSCMPLIAGLAPAHTWSQCVAAPWEHLFCRAMLCVLELLSLIRSCNMTLSSKHLDAPQVSGSSCEANECRLLRMSILHAARHTQAPQNLLQSVCTLPVLCEAHACWQCNFAKHVAGTMNITSLHQEGRV